MTEADAQRLRDAESGAVDAARAALAAGADVKE